MRTIEVFSLVAATALLFTAGMYITLYESAKLKADAVYDPIESRGVVYYALAAVCSDQSLSNWSCGETCAEHPGVIDVSAFYNATHSAKGYVAYNPNSNLIIVSVRGSVDLKNWLADFHVWLHKVDYCDGCKVEDGFYAVYIDIRENILNQVQYLHDKYPTAKVLLTGHSLGGAVVTIATVEVSRIAPIYQLHTFGSPRVGNPAFAQYLDQILSTATASWRVVNYHDPVPHLPLQQMEYRHINDEVWFNTRNRTDIGDYDVCRETEEPYCSNSVPAYLYNPEDHVYYVGVHMSPSC